MPSTSLQMFAAWSNYNLTVGDPRPPYGTLGLTIENLYHLHCSDLDEDQPVAAMAATGSVLLSYLAALEKLRTEGSPAGFPPREFAAATVGQGWSFAALSGTPVAQLLAAGLGWCTRLDPALVANDFCGDADKLMIAGGGTRLRELVNVAEGLGLSLPTGGTHLGQSLAGSVGTGTHGSRLGKGGVQNMVRALHLVTGPGAHVWLQPASSPVLGPCALDEIVLTSPANSAAPGQPVTCTVISDDEHFANALIHLGAMGIVNAMVVELVAIERFNVLAIDAPVCAHLLADIAEDAFAAVAPRLGLTEHFMSFYELTLDPHDPLGPHAAHLVYTEQGTEGLAEAAQCTRPVAAEPISCLVGHKRTLEQALPPIPIADTADASPDPVVDALLRMILHDSGAASVFEHYRKEGGFTRFTRPIDPDTDAIARGTWGAIHRDEITGGVPGALYNASFAIDRANSARAIPAIAAAVKDLAPSFVFTLRFVDDAAGTLAFTRFTRTTVIEIDGLSPLAIGLFKAQYLAATPAPDPAILAGFERLASTVERGAMAVRAALDAAGIAFSMHWGKLGNLDAAKVAADYSGGPLEAWRSTRAVLLAPPQRTLFASPAVMHYGLVP